MGIKKVSELSFDDIVRMKVTDVAVYCGYSVDNMRGFHRKFKQEFGFSFADYKRNMIHDFVRQNGEKMTTRQLAKICNQTHTNIAHIKKLYGLKTYQEKARTISDLLSITDEEIRQTVLDLYPNQYIKIKIKAKIKTSDIKIKMKRMARYWSFVILAGRRKVAEGEYHKELPFDAKKEIKQAYLRIV